jgi:hypothetical protein
MSEFLTEQMRSLARRLMEIDSNPAGAKVAGSKETVPTEPTKGSLISRQLADIIGMEDLNLFNRALNKIRQGKEDKLTRQEMTELSIAFIKLILADTDKTNKAMALLKRVSAKSPE